MTTSAYRQKQYLKRLKEKGYERINVTVHKDDKGQLKRFAEKLKEEREKGR